VITLKAKPLLDLRKNNFLKERKKEIIVLLLSFIVLILPAFDKITPKYINSSLLQAGSTYLITRTINATVSVIKHSEINFNAGIGGSLALGEALDPIDDATERFSDLLTLGIWSLGAEKIIYELSKFHIIGILIVILALINVIIRSRYLYKLLLILIFIRIFMPFSAIVSYVADKYYFTPQITQLNKSLKPKDNIQINFSQKDSSFFDKIKNSFSSTAQYIENIKSLAKYYIENSTKIINILLNLGFLYLAKFLLNILLLPLLLFYSIKNLAED
jgi:hypothetical protein